MWGLFGIWWFCCLVTWFWLIARCYFAWCYCFEWCAFLLLGFIVGFVLLLVDGFETGLAGLFLVPLIIVVDFVC